MRRANDLFNDTLTWALEHLDEPVTVEDLARRAAMSPRSFARHFRAATGTTPYRWLIRQRVLLAQRLLETSDLAIDDIAVRCGLGSAANLRAHFSATGASAPRRPTGAPSTSRRPPPSSSAGRWHDPRV